ncbi:MAG TPA: hypothetical protein VL688_03555 [Verrucomicrobiae bacterium]|nr:hypothetical protein [Verrucomicrobiae bacterium]
MNPRALLDDLKKVVEPRPAGSPRPEQTLTLTPEGVAAAICTQAGIYLEHAGKEFEAAGRQLAAPEAKRLFLEVAVAYYYLAAMRLQVLLESDQYNLFALSLQVALLNFIAAALKDDLQIPEEEIAAALERRKKLYVDKQAEKDDLAYLKDFMKMALNPESTKQYYDNPVFRLIVQSICVAVLMPLGFPARTPDFDKPKLLFFKFHIQLMDNFFNNILIKLAPAW